MTKVVLYSLVLSCFLGSALGAPTKFNFKLGSFQLQFPNNWRATKNLYGMPLTLSGPISGKSRPIITVTPTPLKKISFDSKKVERTYREYKENRRKWLNKYDGVVISFDPLRKIKWSQIDSGYRVGYSYEINGVELSEASYYLVCKEKLYHLKYLIRKNQTSTLKDIKTILRSFECL